MLRWQRWCSNPPIYGRINLYKGGISMQYIQYIEESQTWKCPKTGKWKVTCVGGGHPEPGNIQ